MTLQRDNPAEVFTDGYGLLKAQDKKDHLHRLKRPSVPRRLTVRHWNIPGILDQGSKPHCVGFSVFNYLRASPIRNKPQFQPIDIYNNAQLLDEWPGTNYDGTSVRGAFKWLHKQGFVSEYLWATSAHDVMAHLLVAGPVCLGTTWHQAMDKPGKGNYIWPEGESVGGHAYLAIGADSSRRNPDGSKGAIRIANSWGESWGDKGRCWISVDSLDRILTDFGEACVAKEVLVK